MGLMDKFQKKKKESEPESEPLRPNMNEVSAPSEATVQNQADSIAQMEAQLAKAKAEVVARQIEPEPVETQQVAEKEIAVPQDSEAFVQHLQNEFARVFRQMRPLEDHLIEIENLLAKYGQKPEVPKD